MARKTRRLMISAPDHGRIRPLWPGYVLTALLAAALGAGSTYFALRPVPTTAVGLAALAAANHDYDQKQWPQAIASYTAAIANGEDNPDVRTDFGTAYRFAGQPQLALKQYEIAQQENPQHENSLFNQGGAYADMNNAAQALAAWQKYVLRFPHGQHVADARAFIATIQAHTQTRSPK